MLHNVKLCESPGFRAHVILHVESPQSFANMHHDLQYALLCISINRQNLTVRLLMWSLLSISIGAVVPDRADVAVELWSHR